MDLAHYAAVLGIPPARLGHRTGQRHDVVIDESSGIAWRFPRTLDALETLDISAARAQAAHEMGLCAPSVVAVVDGELGAARMGLRLVSGVGMTASTSDDLGPSARTHLVNDLVGIITSLATAHPVSWAGSPATWPDRWSQLAARLQREVMPLIPSPDGRRRAGDEIAAAQEAAASVGGSTGLVHGDLGGENVVLDPVTGHVNGVLDWDGAAPGDPAVDLAAVLAHARPWLADGLLTADPSLVDLQRRARAYTDTFALQQALWGVESGDQAAVRAGLASYG